MPDGVAPGSLRGCWSCVGNGGNPGPAPLDRRGVVGMSRVI
jgi:hypothetical protein